MKGGDFDCHRITFDSCLCVVINLKYFLRKEMDTDALRRATNKQKATDIDQNLLENGTKPLLSCQNTPIFFYLKFRHLAVITVR